MNKQEKELMERAIRTEISGLRSKLITDIQIFKQDLRSENDFHKKELTNTMNFLFESGDFIKKMKKDLQRFLYQEIRVSMEDVGVQKIIADIVKNKINEQIKDLTKEVVMEVVKQTNKKLKREYEITKQLTYSIDATIKHTLMESPISLNTEEIIKKKITKFFESIEISDIKRLEEKTIQTQ